MLKNVFVLQGSPVLLRQLFRVVVIDVDGAGGRVRDPFHPAGAGRVAPLQLRLYRLQTIPLHFAAHYLLVRARTQAWEHVSTLL